MKDGFIKAAAAVPKVCVANPADNAREILRLIREAVGRKVRILAFPELSLTGYTCGDLFLQEQLLKKAPDGPKVGSVSLSPRGDWRMPSDAETDAFLAETPEI